MEALVVIALSLAIVGCSLSIYAWGVILQNHRDIELLNAVIGNLEEKVKNLTTAST